ncbi:MAG: hypothetical protein CO125_10685 [Hydrogenophilales bacterium CG_4_9_14_3_um_filter_59_35]|nr:MAG: hypothetical protein CO125_10685 [Hydrogenophilales bacterium CG_4_9_14_3_um_filter_59_35]
MRSRQILQKPADLAPPNVEDKPVIKASSVEMVIRFCIAITPCECIYAQYAVCANECKFM